MLIFSHKKSNKFNLYFNSNYHFLGSQKSKSLVTYTVDVFVRIAGGNAKWCNFISRRIWPCLVKLCVILPFNPATTFLETCFKVFWQNTEEKKYTQGYLPYVYL